MRTCRACGEANPPEARFCGQCGSLLADACERCGTELPERVRFCPSCGAPVAEPLGVGEERKVVTVLFSDVAGSTGLGERLDPERLKDVMGAYFDTMSREIESEGGTVEKFIGDAVMAVFGVPVAHEDDPTRALRAALRMRRGLERLNRGLQADHGVTLDMRIGVNTGEVVAVTVPRPGQGMVTGDAVNVAARLEQNAESNQILVSERTARAARGLRLREVGRLALKGKEQEVRAFEVMELEAIPHPGTRRGRPTPSELELEGIGLAEPPARPAHLAPMVGRDREMALLRTVYERVASERRPHLVTIYGEAGVGKTRLVEEFEAWTGALADPPRVVRGRCLPYGEGVTYWPLAEILKEHADVFDDDTSDDALRKIEGTVGKLLTDADPLQTGAERTAAALAFTLGLEDPAQPFAGSSSDPRLVRAETSEAWRRYFTALARQGPTLAVIEDIHWADPALLELLQELPEHAEGPLLFMCPARPELTAREPGWGGGRLNFSGLLLDPLQVPEATTLLDFLLGQEDMPSEIRARILERSGGNPFFLEEISRHVVEERSRVRAEEGFLAGSETFDVEIPDTVQGVLAARMDLLGGTEKRVLQTAAVVGKVFWSGAVARLLSQGDQPAEAAGPLLRSALAGLEDRGLVVARLASTMAGEREYAFRHILTRDVAYESLPRKERAAAHAAVGAWIEERAGQRFREFAELLAHHYAEAHREMEEEGRREPARVEELRARAFRYSLIASEEARAKFVLPNAELHAEVALSLAGGTMERSLALEALGRTYFHDYQGDLAWQCLKEAVDLRMAAGEEGTASVAGLCAAALEIPTRWRGAMRSRLTREEMEPYLEIGVTHARDDTEEQCRLLIVQSFFPMSFRELSEDERELEEARRSGERAAELAQRLSRPDLGSAALDGVAAYYLIRGQYAPLEQVVERRLELLGSLADPQEAADAYSMAARVALQVGRYRDAFAHADEGYRTALPAAPVLALDCLDWRALARCWLPVLRRKSTQPCAPLCRRPATMR